MAMGSAAPTVAVVGAGIVGVTTALALVENGCNVLLLDRLVGVASATSKSNGAQLSYAYADAMATPGLIGMAGRILLGQEAGLKFKLKPSLHNLNWLMAFLREGSKNRFLANTKSSLAIALRSKAQMQVWQQKYGFAFDHKINGKLQILPDQNAVEGQADLLALKQSMGFSQSILTQAEAIEREPALVSFGGEIAGALYSPDDEVGDPHKFAKAAVAHILDVSPNNKFLGAHDVLSVETHQGRMKSLVTNQGNIEADAFVFATGHWGPELGKQLGFALPVVPVAGYSLTYPMGPNAPKNSITDTKAKIVICPLGERLRIAGLADIGLSSQIAGSHRIKHLRTVLTDSFPGAAVLEGDGDPWIGHRPVTPNSQPIVGATALPNGFVNCGHGTLGWTMAAATAAEVASKVVAAFK